MSDKRIAKHYKNLLKLHGDSAVSAQYSSRETQERRFRILADIGDLTGAKILDFGCGSGHFLTYLLNRNVQISNYTGVDIVEELLEVGRNKHPDFQFCLFSEIDREMFDFVFVCGVFNNKRKNNRLFYQSVVQDLFARCNNGLAFNLMSTWVDYRDPSLFYESPERAWHFVKEKVTPLVTLRHDYHVKPDVIPFEFAIYAYRSLSNF